MNNYVSFLIVKLYHYIVHRGNNYIDVNGSNHNEYYENVCILIRELETLAIVQHVYGMLHNGECENVVYVLVRTCVCHYRLLVTVVTKYHMMPMVTTHE